MVSKLYQVSFLILTLFCFTSVQAAVKIVECEDEEGNRSFQKVCPTGSTIVSEKKVSTGVSSDTSSKAVNIQATIYLVPDCDACDEVKEFLSTRNISITEKNVKDDIELQAELSKLAGALKVPTTIIGEEILSGYSRNSFMEALKTAGYIEEGS